MTESPSTITEAQATSEPFTSDRADFERYIAQLNQLKSSLESVVIGQSELVSHTLIALLAQGHILIEGVPGLGKTLLVRALAKTFQGSFSRIQFTPDLMPSDVTGHSLYQMDSGKFTVRKGPIFTNLLLADEINRAPAKTQSALLEVMQEKQVTIDGESLEVPQPFMVLATQNPIEQEGTYPLPEAETDRFMMKVKVSFPREEDELAIVQLTTQTQNEHNFLDTLSNHLNPESLALLQSAARQIEIDQEVQAYVVRIVRATRNWPGVIRGAGPRGSIYLTQAAKAWALLQGREFVIPDDAKQMALPVLRHRLLLSADLEIEGTDTDQLLQGLLNEIEAPRK